MIRTAFKRFRSFLIVCAIFVAGGCCGMSLAIIVVAPGRTPTPTPTIIALQIATQTATSTATASATVTLTATLAPTTTHTPSLTNTPTSTPTKKRPTVIPTNTKREAPATNTPRNWTAITQTPQSAGTAVSDFVIYEEQIKLALSVFASKRDIVSVKVVDGRPNGGERVISVTYRTIEDDLEARAKELLDIYVVIGASLQASEQDVDAVTLTLSDQKDNTIAVSRASKEDLVGYHDGTISMQELIDRIKIENKAN
jgi:hypothetical protein